MIRLEEASWRAGQTAIGQDIALHVRKGKTFGLVGSNGSGKSMELRLVAGVLTPSTGRVRLDGIDQTRLSRRRAARMVAFVAQPADTAERVIVRDAVELGRSPGFPCCAPSAPGMTGSWPMPLPASACRARPNAIVSGGAFGRRAPARPSAPRAGAGAADPAAGQADKPPRHPPAAVDPAAGA